MSPGSLAAMLALLLLNGMFVAAEYSLVRARRERLEDAARRSRGARAALSAIGQLDRSLSTCQLGVTMTSIGIGFLGEASLAPMFSPLLRGSLGLGVAAAAGIGISYLIITTVQITAAELMPKFYALQRPEATAQRLSPLLLGAYRLLRPFVFLLTRITRLGLALIGAKGAMDAYRDELPGPAELDALIARASLAGALEKSEAGMLAGVIDLHERCAYQVMTPIFDVAAVTVKASCRQALEMFHASGHRRLLVLEREHGDHALGVVSITEIAWELAQQGPEAPISPCLHEVHTVPETKPLDELLAEFQSLQATFALVSDEYGRLSGIVTGEDIIEEIVGELPGERREAPAIKHLEDGSLVVDGHLGLHDLADEQWLPDWTADHDATIGGVVFTLIGRLPAVGDSVQRDGYQLSVRAVTANRVSLVHIAPPPAPPADEDGQDAEG